MASETEKGAAAQVPRQVNNMKKQEKAGWLHVADLAEYSLQRSKTSNPPLYTDEQRRKIEEFIRYVRENDGKGIDEVYTWDEIIEMFQRG